MPRLTHGSPSYCRNRSTGHAYVTIDYRYISLGRWKSPASLAKYRALLAEYHANGGTLPDAHSRAALTIAALIDRSSGQADASHLS